MPDLYVMHHATCARKVLFVVLEKKLFEKGTSLKSHEVAREYLRTPEYRKLNPDGVVPTLVATNGEVLVESSVIMRFLDDAYGPTLQPLDPLERAKMNLWMKWVDEKYFIALQAPTVAVFMTKMFGLPPDEPRLTAMLDSLTDYKQRVMREDAIRNRGASPYVKEGLAQVKEMLDRMETALEKHEWLAGPDFTLADCAITPLVLRLQEFGLDAAWTNGRPHVTRWWKAVSQRPALAKLVAMANQALLTELTGSIGDARPDYLRAISV